MAKELTINEMLDELEYQAKHNDNEMMIKEGLQIILNKLKDSNKWKQKK
jgi:hypothetical protein